jgi:glutamine---fructose-6-phosphate transaminase (isomerizing)
MCGVFGINSKHPVAERLLEGLFRLEYRGYDSAGIACIDQGKLYTIKAEGKVNKLQEKVSNSNYDGNIGIAHTRWATHGAPSVQNAHPHSSNSVAIVHNGIIENNDDLRAELIKEQFQFNSDTDSEVVLHLIEKYLKLNSSYIEAVRKATDRLEGSFAIIAIFKDHPDVMIATKKHSPLAVGYGDKENFVGSDAYSLSKCAHSLSYLKDGDIAIVNKEAVEILDENGNVAKRHISKINAQTANYDKGQFSHYMQKEIYEQPTVSRNVLDHYISKQDFAIKVQDLDFKNINRIYIIACGTSCFAGMVAKYWFEEIVKIPVTIEISSEFSCCNLPPEKNSLAVFISQSGETADTISALRVWNKFGLKSVAIVNVEESTISRETNYALPIYAGQEIGVASTKAFTNQLIVLACLVIKVAEIKESISAENIQLYTRALLEVPGRIAEILSHDYEYKKIAQSLVSSKSILYIGRGVAHAIALEGALKLKEISYIHAEAIIAGELKHGSIALVDEDMYVVAIAPEDRLFNKVVSNIKTVIARKGKILLLSNAKGCDLLGNECADVIPVNQAPEMINPIIYTIPLQLIAYHTGILKGNNVDQPRNLAKSVTVE